MGIMPIPALLFLLTIHVSGTDADRILMLPMTHRSHINYFTSVGGALIDRGHEVYIVLAGGDYKVPDTVTRAGFQVLRYDAPSDYMKSYNKHIVDYLLYGIEYPDDLPGSFRLMESSWRKMCEYPLVDKTLLKQIENLKFDLVINDGLFIVHCYYVIPARLGLPYMSLTSVYFPTLIGVPAIPSVTFTPFVTEAASLREMTFLQRVRRAVMEIYITYSTLKTNRYMSNRVQHEFADVLSKYSLSELASRSVFWLLNIDPIVSVPRPIMPHAAYIGGQAITEAKPLKKDLQEYLDNAKEGVIVVSFGSLETNLPKYITQKLLSAFEKLPESVLWKFNNPHNQTIPDNVRLMEWIPQRDLLAHPKTRLFITHCGNNGRYEAIYSGVPMVGFPIFGDQKHNCAEVKQKGFGETLLLATFTVDDLIYNIRKVLGDKSYAERIKKLGIILKDPSEPPLQRAVFWVEHVLKYGADHLRSSGIDMPWYQYFMVDILVLILAIIILTTSLFVLIICNIYRQIIGKRKTKQA